MPRHTHPREVAKHDRGATRAQRDRFISRRWALAKAVYRSWGPELHPEVVRRERPPGMWWPFDLDRGRFARNPFTQCSCDACRVPAAERRADRRRGERAWRRDWADELGG